jgi:hypothetical protein
MKYNRRFRTLAWVLIATTTAGIGLWLVARGSQNTASRGSLSQPVPYTILYDERGFIIRIGVKADVNEEQLRATLVKAADEHQDDAARDYLMMEHLLVEAYLEREGRLSSVPAGRIRRYVLPRNPESREDTATEQDSFTINLDEAKRTLQ